MSKLLLIAGAFLLMVPVCYAQKAPKGSHAITIDAPARSVRTALVSRFAPAGFQIDSDSDYQMVFSREMDGGQAVLTQMLMGNGYSEKPRQILYFTLVESDSRTVLIGRQEASVRTAFGKINRVSLDSGKGKQAMIQALEQVKIASESK